MRATARRSISAGAPLDFPPEFSRFFAFVQIIKFHRYIPIESNLSQLQGVQDFQAA